ncbi:unnamed protein product [Arctia plantaginis]|uniref:Uncharacterized protein n=1 Tax=Arctia plantaginis TaxID=874455 RepID=A0A8S0Z383_ARCPL|nr:unnamed protein product [Arctia plantaginis]CAB3254768.1 unnamed protein product [Arctia plantaginis]
MTLRRSDSLPTQLRVIPIPSEPEIRKQKNIPDSSTILNLSDPPVREEVIATWKSLQIDVKKIKNGFAPKKEQISGGKEKADSDTESFLPTFACSSKGGRKKISYNNRQINTSNRAGNLLPSIRDTGQVECGSKSVYRRRSLLQRLLSWRTPECDCHERYTPTFHTQPRFRPEDLCTCGISSNQVHSSNKFDNKQERGRSKSVGYEASREVAQFRRCASAGATVGAETAAALRARAALTLTRRYYPEGGWGWTITVVGTIVQVLSHGLQLGGGTGAIACTAAVKYHVSPLYTHEFINVNVVEFDYG